MARKQLINLHSSVVKHPSGVTLNPEIAVGEIVIQAVKTAATIYSKVEDGSYAEFIDKTQVQALINASSVADRVEDLEEAVSAISGTLETVESTANSALQSVSASGTNAYVSAVAGEKSGESGAKTQQVTVTANVAGDLANVGSGDTKLADAYKVKQYVDAETSARQGKDTELENALTSLTQDFNYAVSGIGKEQGSIKSYVDGQISTAIGSVYKVKGSVDNYSDLAIVEDPEIGDVYNVVSAATVDGKWYPAGTNWVCTQNSGETVVWDALGGTIDLSVYAYTSALTAEQQARTDGDKAINDKIGGSYTSANTVHSAIVAAKTGADNSLKTVSASGANNYVSASAGTVSGEAGAKTQAITVTANVSSNINAETERGKLADAYEVRTLVSGATASTKSVSDRVGVLEGKIGTNSAYSSSHTISDAVASLESTAVTAVTVDNTSSVGVTATKTGNSVALNLDNIVIDCGTY